MWLVNGVKTISHRPELKQDKEFFIHILREERSQTPLASWSNSSEFLRIFVRRGL
jgi:hypothetical protein